jgi:hypothetical protein
MLPKDTTGEELISIARTQTELARVADQGNKAKTSGVKAFAMNSSLTINSDKTRLLAYMQKNGFSYSSKTLSSGRNAQTDAKLKAAVTSSTYDDTFRLIWTSQMTAYTTLLKQRLVNSSGTNERKMLTEDIEHVEMLIEQSKM